MTKVDHYEYDVFNFYEAGFMTFQWIANLGLLIRGMVNIWNIPKWREEKAIKVSKLYCINTNCMVIVLGKLFFFSFHKTKQARLLYQFDAFYFFATQQNINLLYYCFFELFSSIYLSFLTNLISIKW